MGDVAGFWVDAEEGDLVGLQQDEEVRVVVGELDRSDCPVALLVTPGKEDLRADF